MSADPVHSAALDMPVAHPEIQAAGGIYRGVLGRYTTPIFRFGRLWRRYTANPRQLARARGLVPAILAQMPLQPDLPHPSTYEILSAVWTITDVAVIGVGVPDGTPTAYIKLPGSLVGVSSLHRQEAVLAALQADGRLDGWRSLVPVPWWSGVVGGQAFLVERAVPGVELRSMRAGGESFRTGLKGAAAAISELHRRTAVTRHVDARLLEQWVDAPLALMQRLSAALAESERVTTAILRAGDDLRGALSGRALETGWMHGDFWTSNVLVAPDGSVSGIVDWERAAPDEPAFHDLLHLVLHMPRLEESHRDLGATVRALLAGENLDDDEWALLRLAPLPFPATREGLRLMLLLYWLRYVTSYLAKVAEQARNPWWVRRNIADVLLAAEPKQG